ncbi:DUF6470 family protein [Evansella cellulosilytica]|uniref:Uncharacterized protein n=1 Tax=Evansella cellulosilytica (strain ATCC 21833 / DSM 2522 / FERM P-1141 / JCM 9156 / N-4) TaxID=649639 RepID=E6TS95_EVAC2|nr:DUF6470 family protein [Evansella cellulosilytica]ADU31864.1 hypothetical protein Bcell_3623 [Evansella cellulosilytica DSM 2522]
MELARYHIQSERAITGIASQRPEMTIRQRPADMEIKQELNGNLRISSTAAKLFINQTEAFADADLKGPLRRSNEWHSSTKQKVYQYIAKTMREGEQYKSIENGGNAIANVARQNGERAPKSYNVSTVPQPFRVKIDHVPSEVRVQADWPEPSIRFHKNEPDITIPKWQSNVYIQQKNAIHFSVTGNQVDRGL